MAHSDTQFTKNKISDSLKLNAEFSAEEVENPLFPIQRDLLWLNKYLSDLIYIFFNKDTKDEKVGKKIQTKKDFINQCPFPKPDTDCPYDRFLKKNLVSHEERLIISTAIAPHFSAGLLNTLCYEDPGTSKPFVAVGGMMHNGVEFLPTIDTMRFIVTKKTIIKTSHVDFTLSEKGNLIKNNILRLNNQTGNTYWNKQVVQPTEEFLAYIKGEKYEPSFNSNFPASKISTGLNWADLILPYDTMQELKEVDIWLKHKDRMMQHKQLSRVIKPGFRCLFYGPPGTGKTLTASLLGKTTGLDVYRVDLSMVVSKWVGETEKNLKGIFDQAQNKNWILFFDEADSLFGKRTQTKSSNDRHANQEVAYLLQRIEDFPGLVLLATNLKDNIDEAFSRRFQSMVYFPVPDAETRLTLWKKTFPEDFELEACIDLQKIADNHEIAGGIIVNVVRYCVLMALDRNSKIITEEDLETGIMKELRKSGKVV